METDVGQKRVGTPWLPRTRATALREASQSVHATDTVQTPIIPSCWGTDTTNVSMLRVTSADAHFGPRLLPSQLPLPPESIALTVLLTSSRLR